MFEANTRSLNYYSDIRMRMLLMHAV